MSGRTANIKSIEDFLKISINQISQVYNGRRDCCRCGCGGEYVSSSFADGNRSEINDKLIEKRIQRAKRMIKEGAEYDLGYTYLDLKTGNNRTLTFYFDDLK